MLSERSTRQLLKKAALRSHFRVAIDGKVGLPSLHRLKRRQDFQSVYRQGIRRCGRCLILRALSVTSPGGERAIPTRIGISISLKVSKKAIIRNKIKRQIRAALRELLPAMESNWLVAIVVRPEAVGCKYEHFLRELKQLLTKAEIIHGH